MPRTSCVQVPTNDTFIIVRACYVKICGGSATAAALLHYFEHWHNFKVESLLEANFRGRPDLWQYHTAKDLEHALLGIGKRHAIDEAKKLLTNLGVIQVALNTHPVQLGSVTHYLFCPDVVNTLLVENSNTAMPKTAARRGGKQQHGDAENSNSSIYIDTPIDSGQRSQGGPMDDRGRPIRGNGVTEHLGVVLPWETPTFAEAWVTWRAFKLKKHKFTYAMTETEQAALNKLRKLSGDSEAVAHAIMAQSMEHQWKGFFELKTCDNATHQGTSAGGVQAAKPGISAARVDAIRNW